MKESMFLEIINAKCLDGLKMLVSFNNGEHRLFDFATIVDSYPVFAPLKDKATLKPGQTHQISNRENR